MRGLLGTLRGLPGSLHKRCRHGSPKSPDGVPPPSIVPYDAVASHAVWRLGGESSVSLFAGRSPLRTAFHRFTHVQACGFASAPSAPPVTRTHWASATELQRPKLGKDFHLLAPGIARRTAKTDRPSWPVRFFGSLLVPLESPVGISALREPSPRPRPPVRRTMRSGFVSLGARASPSEN